MIENRNQIILHWQRGSPAARRRDALAEEDPLQIRVDTRPVSVTMRTRGHDKELAAGFLFSEGLIRGREDILAIKPYARNREDNTLDVFLSPNVTPDLDRLKRHVIASSSCGLCGKASIGAIHQHFRPVRAGPTGEPELLVQSARR